MCCLRSVIPCLMRQLERLSTVQVSILVGLLLLGGYGFQRRTEEFSTHYGWDHQTPDSALGKAADALTYLNNPPGYLADFLTTIGESGRRLYAWSEVTMDLAFPIVYGTLLAVWLYRRYSPQWSARLLWLPLTAAVVDILFENSITAYLAFTNQTDPSQLAYVAITASAIKFSGIIASILLGLVGEWNTHLRKNVSPSQRNDIKDDPSQGQGTVS
ncbi:MAG: hypothetical protein R3C01_15960 [Planctomycetaceae bacterium]